MKVRRRRSRAKALSRLEALRRARPRRVSHMGGYVTAPGRGRGQIDPRQCRIAGYRSKWSLLGEALRYDKCSRCGSPGRRRRRIPRRRKSERGVARQAHTQHRRANEAVRQAADLGRRHSRARGRRLLRVAEVATARPPSRNCERKRPHRGDRDRRGHQDPGTDHGYSGCRGRLCERGTGARSYGHQDA